MSVFADIVRDTLSDFYEISENADSLTFEPKMSLAEHDYKRMEFLYALTLFRHSRHPNAIGAEGAFSCPHRYQSFAVDNDFVRAVQVNSWIQDLCNKRVFFSKPGGSLWMHRDVREAVHRVLESTNISRFRGGKENRGYSSFRQARGRKHFWIGEWYYKAFCSSGHLTPVIECVYHLISSAIYSQYAFPKQRRKEKIEEASLLSHRCMMFESAMVQASKMLLLSWRSIELWQSSSADVAWLNEPHRIQIKRELEQAATSLIGDKRTNKRIEKCMLDFLTIHSALHDAVILEGGRSKRGATSWSSPESMIMRLAETDEKPVPETLGSRKELQHGIDKIRLPEKATGTSNKTESEEPQDFWSMLRSEIDPGTHKLWDTIIEISRNRPENYERFGREKAAWKADAENRHFQDFIWFLGEAAYVLLRRAKLKLHATNEIDESTWIASTICCNLGIDLCKHLPASNLAYEVRSKIKMHSIYSVGLANLGRFFEANRHLNEAQGLLSKWQGATEEDHAVISIRRAEVKVTECRWIAMFLSPELELNDGNCIKLRRDDEENLFIAPDFKMGAVRCWMLSQMAKCVKECVKDKELKVLPPSIFEAFRKARPVGLDSMTAEEAMDACGRWRQSAQSKLEALMSSVLDEAVRSLEIAEKNLGGSSQSSLWWSRLHTLRLRVYGLLNYIPETAELCIVFRKQSADNGIFRNFLSAKRIAGEDDFRKLRALKYFLHANRWYCRYREPDNYDRHGYPNNDNKGRLEKFLPESFRQAKELAHELWKSNNKLKNDDLLNQAIRACFNQFPEVKPPKYTD